MSYQGQDRRRAPRVAKQVSLTLTDHVGELAAVTRDISASGANCTLARHLPLMSKLRIHFALPGSGPVACQGVVVRVHPAKPDPAVRQYDVAIFFNDIADDTRARLSQFVTEHLQPRTTRHR